MNVFDLAAKLSLDSSEYESGLGNAKQIGLAATGAIATGGVAAAAAIGAVAVKGTQAILQETAATAQYGDEIDKMSQKMGLSTEAYQKWDYVLNLAGTEMSSMTTGLKTLTNKFDEAKNGSEDAQAMFAQLGISMEQLGDMSREDLFAAAIAGFQQMEDSTERAALANDLFGKSGQELAPLFNTSVEETQALMEQVDQLGMVMSDDAVKAAADYKDALTTMQGTLAGIKNSVFGDFMPAITSVMDGLTQVFAGDKDLGLEKIGEGIDGFIETITSKLPVVLTMGGEIIVALATGIIENLPDIVTAALDTILMLVNTIVENLPFIIETAIQIVLTLAEGLTEALPALIPAVVQAIVTIIQVLAENEPMIIEAALNLIIALVDGIMQAFPIINEAMPKLIATISVALAENAPALIIAGAKLLGTLIKGFVQAIPSMIYSVVMIIPEMINALMGYKDYFLRIGGEFINGLWDGIAGAWSGFMNNVQGTMGKLVDGVKGIFGIHSPSKVFAGIGENMALGMQEGWDDEFKGVKAGIESNLNFETTGAMTGSGKQGGQIVIPVYVGGQLIDEYIIDATQRIAYRSGGVL